MNKPTRNLIQTDLETNSYEAEKALLEFGDKIIALEEMMKSLGYNAKQIKGFMKAEIETLTENN